MRNRILFGAPVALIVVVCGLLTLPKTLIGASDRLQGKQAQATPSPTPLPTPDERAILYAKWLEATVGGAGQQKVAYESAKEYVTKFPTPEDENLQNIRKWLAKYEKDSVESELTQAVNAKDVGKTFEAGRKMLKEDPENFRVLSTLVVAAATVGKYSDANLNREAAGYAGTAIKLLESKKVTNQTSFRSDEDALGFLNYALGRFLADTSPAEAIGPLRKAAASKTSYSQEPTTYLALATALNVSEYTPLQAEYAKKYAGQAQTPEGEAMLQRLYQSADRLIDAYARTVALLNKPGQEAAKAQIMAPLTTLYKSRNNNSEAGLNELIASVMSKPLP